MESELAQLGVLMHKDALRKTFPTGGWKPGWSFVPALSLGRVFPFVFPWSTLVGMTSAVISRDSITVARGKVTGQELKVVATVQLDAKSMDRSALRNTCRGADPVCVCLPRNKTLVRHFRLPAASPNETQAMLSHLLENELPTDLDQYAWVWEPHPTGKDGFRQVTVHLARNDKINQFLEPLVSNDCNVVGLVPEGWVWAFTMEQFRSANNPQENHQAHSILIQRRAHNYLVVEREGHLLFDMMLPTGEPGMNVDLGEAQKQFQDLHGQPLPTPGIWPDAQPPHNVIFAGAVAAASLERDNLLLSSDMRRNFRKRTWLAMVSAVAKLALLGCLIWLALNLVQDHHTRGYLVDLHQQLEAEVSRVAELETEFKAIRENNRAQAGNSEILLVLNSLRSDIQKPIFLEHLNYVQGRGVTLRGVAPNSSLVLEMTEKLSANPQWKAMRVIQMRTEKVNTTTQVQFVVEGQLP